MFSMSGVVKAIGEADPRRIGPIQQGSHIYSSFCCPAQSQDTWAFHRHHKVNLMVFHILGWSSLSVAVLYSPTITAKRISDMMMAWKHHVTP